MTNETNGAQALTMDEAIDRIALMREREKSFARKLKECADAKRYMAGELSIYRKANPATAKLIEERDELKDQLRVSVQTAEKARLESMAGIAELKEDLAEAEEQLVKLRVDADVTFAEQDTEIRELREEIQHWKGKVRELGGVVAEDHEPMGEPE